MNIFEKIAAICEVPIAKAQEIKSAMDCDFSKCSAEKFRDVALNAKDLLAQGFDVNTAYCYSGMSRIAIVEHLLAE